MSYEQALRELTARNNNVVVLTAENRAAMRTLPDLLGERFIDVGIAEQTMVGMAAGLALRGRLPIVHALATFLTLRAFEFIRTDIGIAGLPVTLVGGVPGFLSEANGPTHQAIEDIALMRGIPRMQVFCPADACELTESLPIIVESGKPSYIRYYAGEPAVKHDQRFVIGEAEVLARGTDVTLLSFGLLLREAAATRKLLERQHCSAGLINLRTLAPIDEAAILDAARTSRLLVTVEDHFLTGGLASIVAEILVRHKVSAAVFSLGLKERWFRPLLLHDLLRVEGFTAEQITALVLATLETESVGKGVSHAEQSAVEQ